MSDKRKQRGIRTRAIHAGERPDPVTGASAPNLVMSTSFVTENPEASFSALELTEDAPYAYTRWANPTTGTYFAALCNLLIVIPTLPILTGR